MSEYRVTDETHIHKQTDTHALSNTLRFGGLVHKRAQKISSACQSVRSKSFSPREPAREPAPMPE